MRITEHFAAAEFEHSQIAARAGIEIHIRPGTAVFFDLQALCAQVLEPLRAALGGRPIIISSGYRPAAVNRLIGGVANSQHVTGEAADIVVPGMAPYDVATAAHDLHLPVDQLIYEFGRWTHLSHVRDRGQRGEVLTAYKDAANHTHYADGIQLLGSIKGARR